MDSLPLRNSYAKATSEKLQHIDYGFIAYCSPLFICGVDNQVQDGAFPDGKFITFRRSKNTHLSDHDPILMTVKISRK